jgi:hypothetical protein
MVNPGGEEPVEVLEMRRATITEVSRILSHGATPKTQMFGASLTDALVTEFECTRKASSMDMGAEFHIECFESFEHGELRELFVLAISYLQELTSALSNADPSSSSGGGASGGAQTQFNFGNHYELFSRILELCTRILSWPFGQIAQIVGIHFSNVAQLLKPPQSWRDVLITPNMEVLSLYGNIFTIARTTDSKLAHMVREGLMMLASLSGDIFGKTEEMRGSTKAQWTTPLSSILTGLLQVDHLSNAELRDMAIIIMRFFSTTSIASLVEAIGVENVEIVMNSVCARTCETMERLKRVAEGNSAEGVNASDVFDDTDIEDTVLGEALDTWLQAWASWSSDATSTVFPNLPYFMFQVFSCYVETRLAAARAELLKSEEDNSTWGAPGESLKSKQDLKNPVIIDQLTSATTIGRMAPRTSLEFLRNSLASITKPLKEFIDHGDSNQESWLKLEELHWMMMILGNFLCHVSHGELSSIPLPLTRLCHTYDEQGEENQLIALNNQILEIVDLENLALEISSRTGTLVWSPLLAETLAWLLSHWASCYLLLSEASLFNYSASLMANYGVESPNCSHILDVLMRKIIINLTNWTGETNTLVQTCQILHMVSKLNTLRMSLLTGISGWNELFDTWTNNNAAMSSFPPKVQRHLMLALAHIVQTDGVEDQVAYLNQLMIPVDESFARLVNDPNFSTHYQTPTTMLALQTTFERLRGALRSTNGRTFKAMNLIGSRYMPGLVELLQVYRDQHSMVISILKIFSDYVIYVLCCTYDEEEMASYNNAVDGLMKTVDQCGIAKRRSSGNASSSAASASTRASSEEAQMEQCDTLEQLLIIMCGVVENEGEDVSRLCFYALSVLAPHIDAEMLQYPQICRHFFHFISAIFGVHASNLSLLEDAMFEMLLGALDVGMHQTDEFIQMAALHAITKISSFQYKMLITKGVDVLQQKRVYLANFITTLLKWLLFEDGFRTELMSSTSAAYFSLVCAEYDAYRETVQSLIQTQTDPNTQARLEELFGSLLNGIELTWSKPSREAFFVNMGKFVPYARGILHRR